MLKSKAKWVYNDRNFIDHEQIHPIPIINQLLIERGIENEEAMNNFIHPKTELLHSPKLLKQMDKAIKRINEAIESQEQIMIYGDYDADGVSSTTLLYEALIERDGLVSFYIPNRFTEGYGLNKQALQKIYDDDYTLVITVDNGISSVDEANYAKEIGLDLIITDHHEVQKEVPDAFALIHPKLSPKYPFKELAGVGVAFKLSEEILGYFPEHLLQYVALGTITDMVPLKDENRTLVYYGLKNLSDNPNIGLKALIELTQISTPYNEEDIGFQIGPRINAVGRLQSAHLAVELLLSDTLEEAVQLSEKIEELNDERKNIVDKIVKEADAKVDTKSGVIILYDKNWHEGVLGIAASRLVKIYDRPVILLNHNTELNTLKGSARSIPAFDLFKNGMQIRDLFNQFGGHAQAAGMSFDFNQLESIQSQLNMMIFQQLKPSDFKSEINIAQSIALEELSEELVKNIDQLAPFGMENPKPIFHVSGKPSQVRQIGSEKNHLKIQYQTSDNLIDVIAFRLGHLYNFITNYAELEIVGELSINEWNGNRTVQIIAEDMAVNERQVFDYRGKKARTNLIPYFNHYKKILFIEQNKQQTILPDHVIRATYDLHEAVKGSIDLLIISDMPEREKDLFNLLDQINTESILVNYDLFENKLNRIPNREDFKKLYSFVMKEKSVDMKQKMASVSKQFNWSKEQIIFMVLVFIELDFIQSENSVLTLNPHSKKNDLEQAEHFQKELEKEKVEIKLYYSGLDELKKILFENMKQDNENTLEETINEP